MSWSERSNGRADITVMDVAAAIGRVPSRCGQALLLAAWTDDAVAQRTVYHSALSLLRVSARDWRRVAPDRLESLAALATDEAISAPLCQTCAGRGQVAETRGEGGLLIVECDSCLGAGLRTLSQRERARRAGIDSKSWRERWEARYKPVLHALCHEHDAALTVVRLNLV